jgi:hypothetical protein
MAILLAETLIMLGTVFEGLVSGSLEDGEMCDNILAPYHSGNVRRTTQSLLGSYPG